VKGLGGAAKEIGEAYKRDRKRKKRNRRVEKIIVKG